MLFMSCVCRDLAFVHCCFVITCWERVGTSWLLFVMINCVLWYPGSGVVLECIEF